MKVEIKYSILETKEIIDLTDYGHDEDVKWKDLTDEEKYEITDGLSEQIIVEVNGEDID